MGENSAIGSSSLTLGSLLQFFDWERISGDQEINMSQDVTISFASMETISYLSIIVFLLVLHVLTNRSLHKLQNRPPTPFPTIPLTGHLYLLKRKKNVSLHYSPVSEENSDFSKQFRGVVAKTLMKLNQTRDKLVQTLIDKCRSMGTDDDPAAKTGHQAQGMIQVLMELLPTEPESYPDEVVKVRLHLLPWSGLFSLLLSHQEVMKKAKAEIDTVMSRYLRCIIKETLRLHPPTPLLLHHYSSEDCTVGGFRVLRRTMLLVNVWALHHDPCIRTEPEKFMPERFEGMEGSKDGLRFLPFGSGRRKYPGESLAIASIALALVLQCFDWEKITS
ncbi:unnamed protein product [Coffea canephora]|uniref:Uncharacterized protein n=1 Tax=Coffea canephora TaxID=49390 RepID=A0A068UK19_COFCA|nr:unnamed protein product [Coffea canephora]